MDRAPDLALAEEHRRALLEVADAAHHAIEIDRGPLVHQLSFAGCSITRIPPSPRWVTVCPASATRSSGKWCVTSRFTSTAPRARSTSARLETPFGFASD